MKSIEEIKSGYIDDRAGLWKPKMTDPVHDLPVWKAEYIDNHIEVIVRYKPVPGWRPTMDQDSFREIPWQEKKFVLEA